MYFDHAATSPTPKAVLAKLESLAGLAAYNPSSSHGKGLKTREEIRKVRRSLASFLGCHEEELYFTSGATESNNLVLQSLCSGKKGHVITSAVEHDSVEKTLQEMERKGIRVTRLAPNELTKERVLHALQEDTFLVSLMVVQNEVGSYYPLHGLGQELRKKRIFFHRDAVQALGKIPFSIEQEHIDLASFSAHKLGGLKGLGMLYVRKGTPLKPLFFGGDQEKKLRPGTENTLAILVLGEVLKELHREKAYAHVVDLHGRMKEAFTKLGGTLLSAEESSPYILPVSFPIPAEVLLSALSLKGVYASAGSACHAGSKQAARILPYLEPTLAPGFIRFSLSKETTKEEVEAMLLVLKNTLEELKRYL